MDNPLLQEPLTLEHVKPRLLGHWGTTPGLNFIYVHLNRVIKAHDLDMIYICGPGHGGPAMVANTYLEGTYQRALPARLRGRGGDAPALQAVLVPRRRSRATPRPRCRARSTRAASSATRSRTPSAPRFDNPDLIVACVIGDGEAESGPLATSWHSNKFLNPATDGAVLPILHLNGYKIANPTLLARMPTEELESLFVGYGYKPYFVEGSEPERGAPPDGGHARQVVGRDPGDPARGARERQRRAAALADDRAPHAEGLDRPEGGRRQEDRGLLALAPGAVRGAGPNPEHLALLEEWLRSYRPEELFDEDGRLLAELRELAPTGDRRMGANPHANGGLLLRDLRLPDFRDYAVDVPTPGSDASPRRRGRSATSCAT